MRFSGKVALVTGAAVGIGRATVLKLLSEDARVIAWDLNADALARLQEETGAKEGALMTMACDVSDEEAVTRAAAEAKKRFGRIDILVNNAALWRDCGSFLDTTAETWKQYLNVNVMGVVYCTRAVLRDMVDAGYGRIINVSSVAGVYGNAKMAHYSATKGAVISLTRALAKEVTEKGVLVNCVSPGSVSPSDEADVNYTQESALSFMGRTGRDMENANLICFLASDEASYVAGENIMIDGCRKKM